MFIQDAAAAENRRQWDIRAPQTPLQMMAAADVTSTCSTRPEGELRSVSINCQQETKASNAAGVHSDLIVITFQYHPYRFGIKYLSKILFWFLLYLQRNLLASN